MARKYTKSSLLDSVTAYMLGGDDTDFFQEDGLRPITIHKMNRNSKISL